MLHRFRAILKKYISTRLVKKARGSDPHIIPFIRATWRSVHNIGLELQEMMHRFVNIPSRNDVANTLYTFTRLFGGKQISVPTCYYIL